jgi:lipopolysaccharide/colanic/teichoic acid biosynthesis glycosyltransferase
VNPSTSMGKRMFDIAGATLGLVLAGPLLLILAVAIKIESRGPVFFRGVRVGLHGHRFRIFKFRSMVADAEQSGPGITAAGDSRVTRLGRLLRRFKLDELPQLLNVLKGEMSLVGPRPEDPRYVAHYTAEQRRVLSVRPGITGAASVRYRHEEVLLRGPDWETVYLTVIMPDKLKIDLAYIEHWSFGSDLKVLVQTGAALYR